MTEWLTHTHTHTQCQGKGVLKWLGFTHVFVLWVDTGSLICRYNTVTLSQMSPIWQALTIACSSIMLAWNGHSSDSHTSLRDDQPSNIALLSLRHSTPLMGTLGTRQSPFSGQTERQSVAKAGRGLSPTLCWDLLGGQTMVMLVPISSVRMELRKLECWGFTWSPLFSWVPDRECK